MPVTLAQAQVNTQDDIDFAVIDNLRRYSWLLDQIAFDDAATPGTGGGTLVYGYTRLTTPRAAAFRAYNTEYTPDKAQRQRFTVPLVPLGGNFPLDRALANLGPSSSNEVTFQMQQLLAAVRTTFSEAVINGDEGVDEDSFDGLDVMLTGTSNEYIPEEHGHDPVLDWTIGGIADPNDAHQAFDILDEFLSGIVPSTTGGGDIGAPGALPPGVKAILGNTKSISRVKSLARWAGMFTEEKDDLGRKILQYGEWVLVDIGDNATGAAPIIPLDADTGTTDLYAVSFGMDAFHGVSVAGSPVVQTWFPDRATAGAVKHGEMEMGPVAVALRNTRACGVLRNVQVSSANGS